MPWNTFTPSPAPSPGTQSKTKPKILKSDFGDGYTQAAANGINWIRETLTLTWDTLTLAQEQALSAFFIGQGGYIPFNYTSSDSVSKQYTCEDWSFKRGSGGIRSMTATLIQDFSSPP